MALQRQLSGKTGRCDYPAKRQNEEIAIKIPKRS